MFYLLQTLSINYTFITAEDSTVLNRRIVEEETTSNWSVVVKVHVIGMLVFTHNLTWDLKVAKDFDVLM